MKAYIKSTAAISAQQTFDKSLYLKDWVVSEGSYLNAAEPPYRDVIDPKLIRRMSRIIKMGVAAAHEALREAEVEIPDAVIVGTGLGCIEDTIKFLKDIIISEEGILSPTAFIQSTHNTIAGQIALLLQCPNYNFTYSNRGHSFENALIDARVQLADGKNNILFGAAEEMTTEAFNIFNGLGCAGDLAIKDGPGFGEGASFFVFTNEHKEGRPYLQDVCTLNHPTSTELEKELLDFLNKNGRAASDIDLLLLGETGFDQGDFYSKIKLNFSDSTPSFAFKKISGEHFTASGYAMHLAAMILQHPDTFSDTILASHVNPKVKNVLIYNHYQALNHSFMLLSV